MASRVLEATLGLVGTTLFLGLSGLTARYERNVESAPPITRFVSLVGTNVENVREFRVVNRQQDYLHARTHEALAGSIGDAFLNATRTQMDNLACVDKLQVPNWFFTENHISAALFKVGAKFIEYAERTRRWSPNEAIAATAAAFIIVAVLSWLLLAVAKLLLYRSQSRPKSDSDGKKDDGGDDNDDGSSGGGGDGSGGNNSGPPNPSSNKDPANFNTSSPSDQAKKDDKDDSDSNHGSTKASPRGSHKSSNSETVDNSEVSASSSSAYQYLRQLFDADKAQHQKEKETFAHDREQHFKDVKEAKEKLKAREDALLVRENVLTHAEASEKLFKLELQGWDSDLQKAEKRLNKREKELAVAEDRHKEQSSIDRQSLSQDRELLKQSQVQLDQKRDQLDKESALQRENAQRVKELHASLTIARQIAVETTGTSTHDLPGDEPSSGPIEREQKCQQELLDALAREKKLEFLLKEIETREQDLQQKSKEDFDKISELKKRDSERTQHLIHVESQLSISAKRIKNLEDRLFQSLTREQSLRFQLRGPQKEGTISDEQIADRSNDNLVTQKESLQHSTTSETERVQVTQLTSRNADLEEQITESRRVEALLQQRLEAALNTAASLEKRVKRSGAASHSPDNARQRNPATSIRLSPATTPTSSGHKTHARRDVKEPKPAAETVQTPCKFWGSKKGCKRGQNCPWLHDHSPGPNDKIVERLPQSQLPVPETAELLTQSEDTTSPTKSEESTVTILNVGQGIENQLEISESTEDPASVSLSAASASMLMAAQESAVPIAAQGSDTGDLQKFPQNTSAHASRKGKEKVGEPHASAVAMLSQDEPDTLAHDQRMEQGSDTAGVSPKSDPEQDGAVQEAILRDIKEQTRSRTSADIVTAGSSKSGASTNVFPKATTVLERLGALPESAKEYGYESPWKGGLTTSKHIDATATTSTVVARGTSRTNQDKIKAITPEQAREAHKARRLASSMGATKNEQQRAIKASAFVKPAGTQSRAKSTASSLSRSKHADDLQQQASASEVTTRTVSPQRIQPTEVSEGDNSAKPASLGASKHAEGPQDGEPGPGLAESSTPLFPVTPTSRLRLDLPNIPVRLPSSHRDAIPATPIATSSLFMTGSSSGSSSDEQSSEAVRKSSDVSDAANMPSPSDSPTIVQAENTQQQDSGVFDSEPVQTLAMRSSDRLGGLLVRSKYANPPQSSTEATLARMIEQEMGFRNRTSIGRAGRGTSVTNIGGSSLLGSSKYAQSETEDNSEQTSSSKSSVPQGTPPKALLSESKHSSSQQAKEESGSESEAITIPLEVRSMQRWADMDDESPPRSSDKMSVQDKSEKKDASQ